MIYKYCIILLFVFACSCEQTMQNTIASDTYPKMYPEYYDITIPANIAPMNFALEQDSIEKYIVKIKGSNGYSFSIETKKIVKIPMKKWKKLLSENIGKSYFIDVFGKKGQQWIQYKTIENVISTDSIDPYLTYRAIEPGYELSGFLGIYERNISNFDVRALIDNNLANGSCMNCHLTNWGNPNQFVTHFRFNNSGTIIYRDGEYKRINTATPSFINPGIHPAWHPGGRYIAFSTNTSELLFHTDSKLRTETYDSKGNIGVYDIDENKMIVFPQLISPDPREETFPAWSPDGKYLYFCRTDPAPKDSAMTQAEYIMTIRYDLLRISFDEKTCTMGKIDTVINSHIIKKSSSVPRISPNGKFLLVSLSDHGTFAVWQRDSDLYLLDLVTMQLKRLDNANSQECEGYHSWSSNSRWFVVASKRRDALVSLPYFSYVDEQGNATKSFVLPQENPLFYHTNIKSYNVPELVKGKSPAKRYEFADEVTKGQVIVAETKEM